MNYEEEIKMEEEYAGREKFLLKIKIKKVIFKLAFVKINAKKHFLFLDL